MEISEKIKELKKFGFENKRICEILKISPETLNEIIEREKIYPVYKIVDTCAGEFEAVTPYYYSTYNDYENESKPSNRKKVIILGSGPIRIGQGIEFDYCTVHAIKALREENIETIVINNNPETVSTDFDISDKLYFEPLTLDYVMNVIRLESNNGNYKNFLGVIVQFGGQTSINLANALKKNNVKILGTQPDYINIAEDRELSNKFLENLGIPKAPGGTGYSYNEVKEIAHKISYPVLIRPSYVLGGRAMEVVYNDEELKEYMEEAIKFSEDELQKHPILIDKFLADAIEVDVDAVCDREDVLIGGIMEHIEEAGIHSGDSAMILPPQTLKKDEIEKIKEYTREIAINLKTIGLINIQFAVKRDENKVYVIEANPRASRTVPFVSKAIRIPIAKIAAKVIIGKKIKNLIKEYKTTLNPYENLKYVCVKEVVFPFAKIPDIDPALGPEMKSTGEVMGIGRNFGEAFYKAELAAGTKIPLEGRIFISVRSDDKEKILEIAKKFYELNFEIFSTSGTSRFLKQNGIENFRIKKISEGEPNILNYLKNREINLVINIPKLGRNPRNDGYLIRRMCVEVGIPYITTIEAARAAIEAIETLKKEKEIVVKALDEY
ncbi:MAG: carbamoyl-phosphate synthase large subunit [Candidatus Altarchaeaceae archaeon]